MRSFYVASTGLTLLSEKTDCTISLHVDIMDYPLSRTDHQPVLVEDADEQSTTTITNHGITYVHTSTYRTSSVMIFS